MFKVLTVSGVRGTSCDMKTRNRFIEIKYSAPNRFIMFLTKSLVFHNFLNNLVWMTVPIYL